MLDTYKLNDQYFTKVECICKKIKAELVNKYKKYLSDYIVFLESNAIEPCRSIDDYFIEFLGIGIHWLEYSRYIDNLSFFNRINFTLISSINKGSKRRRDFVEKIKSMGVHRLIKKDNIEIAQINLANFKRLIQWMSLSGDFYEEVLRFNNWLNYLVKNKEKSLNILKASIKCVGDFKEIIEYDLDEYLYDIELFNTESKKIYIKREDLFYCIKGRIFYYYNIVCSEIMNSIYHDKFRKSEEKIIILPSCMRALNSKCNSIKSDFGYTCIRCNKNCNINLINRELKDFKCKVVLVPHESDIQNVKKDSNTGIIGVACLTNLVSGGFKALRLGFIPQCVPLNYVGCEKHWINLNRMTHINIDRLINILKG